MWISMDLRSLLSAILFSASLSIVPFSVLAADVYAPSGSNSFMYPGEPVPKDAMRVTIFGSGYGYVRQGQADQSIYVELGNGDTFVFDLGEGSEANYVTMQVPYSKLTNLFVTHHHMDHLGSLPHLYTFGPSADRWTPMNIYGPSGSTARFAAPRVFVAIHRCQSARHEVL